MPADELAVLCVTVVVVEAIAAAWSLAMFGGWRVSVAAKPKPQPPKDRCVARLSYPDGRQCRGDAVGDTPWCPMHTRQVDESRRRLGAVQGGRMYVEEERELEGLSRCGLPEEIVEPAA